MDGSLNLLNPKCWIIQ